MRIELGRRRYRQSATRRQGQTEDAGPIGGDHSYGAHLATEVGFAAADVRAAVIKDSGHWIMEEQPEQAVLPRHLGCG